MALPTFLAQIAFASNFYDAPVWTDVTDYLLSAQTRRGRGGPVEVCNPGEASFVFNNSSGDWDPDDPLGPFYGSLRPNKVIRLSATVGATTQTLFTGYINSMPTTWPDGSDFSVCAVSATDRCKQLARMAVSQVRVEETATARITSLLSSVTYKTINTDAYASRTLAAHTYAMDDPLSAAQEAARSDGGVLFVDSAGTVVFQSHAFRSSNARATTSQGRFGNDATSIPCEPDLTRDVNDALMANRVRLTDAAGVEHVYTDAPAGLVDGEIELDLGSTLLSDTTEADQRAEDMRDLLVDAKPRWAGITLDNLGSEAAAAQSLVREISDRVTVAFIHPGQTTGTAREQWIESVSHSVVLDGTPQWMTTFGLSGLPFAASNGRTAL